VVQVQRRACKGGLTHDQLLREWTTSRLTLRVDRVADGSDLHLENGVEPVTPAWRRREAGDETGLGDRGNVVALVDDDVTIGRHDVVHLPLPDQTLDIATSSLRVGTRLPAPICPIAFGSMPRNIASWAIHWSSNGCRWTRTSVLLARAATR